MVWQTVLCALIGYLVGGINPSYIIGRIRGIDIRKTGSGNAGASNAVIILGAKAGVFSMIFDIAKAYLVVLMAQKGFPDAALFAPELAAACCILGHIFPVLMRFHGGKGLACLGGAILRFDWRLFLILLGVEIVILLVSNYLCFVPISASIIYPIVHGLTGTETGWIGSLFLCAASAGIIYKHAKNIRKIFKGTEMRFSYLWMSPEKKEKERDRIRKNGGEIKGLPSVEAAGESETELAEEERSEKAEDKNGDIS